ncbi:MAG: exo-alpha-sialidase [Fuerstiella sp.]
MQTPQFIVTTLIFLAVCSHTNADDGDWKLQPLKYNNPGLEVDLGVGLWAYPIPIDYDNDGDMDLLVSCPDKPSNGTYFFENGSQDASVKMPVFKPAVRIGNGYHYLLLSERNGQQVVMKPGKEYRRDPETGKFDFNNPINIDAATNPNSATKGRIRANMWRTVDYDGDGDHDLIAGIGDWTELGWDHAYDRQGRWRNGPLHGYIYFTENLGNDDSPEFSKTAVRLAAGGGDIDVYGWPSPNFADFDRDGDLDLLCGEFLDGFTYFQNTGSRTKPVYSAGIRLKNGRGQRLAMHLQMITPTAIDWDHDGDLDLIVGDEDGRVAFVENTGKLVDNVPVFDDPQYFQQQADTLKFGALATPSVYDWDSDGDQDIVCGNTAGSIGWFENLGSADGQMPKWDAPKLLNIQTANGQESAFRIMAGPSGSIQGPCEAKWGYTTLSVADWNSDGDADIIYNSILGKVGLLLNDKGTLVEQAFDSGQLELPPEWLWWQSPAANTLTQWRTTPLALDFNTDGKLDLVMLDQQGFLTFRSSAGKAERIFVDEDNRPLQLNTGSCGRSGRVKLSMVDWDGDGRIDVLVNSENATWYRNCEDRNGKVVLKKIGNLARRNVAGHTSSPAVADFNNDAKPDLIVGSENGRIYHINHHDCLTYETHQLQARPPATAKKPRFPGFISEGFVFDKAPTKQCHASTICRTSRGLVAAWFAGTREGQPDVGIWTSYHDGLKWSRPAMVADGVQHTGRRHPCWNPVLFQPPGDAPTLLFFKVGPKPDNWWGEMLVSYDRGRTFVDRKRLPEGIDGPVRCKPIYNAATSTLLCGSSTEHDGWRVHFESVKLVNGQPEGTWNRIGPINDGTNFNAIQPTFLQHSNGDLQVLCRTKEDVIVSSRSTDQGGTWSRLEATDLPNPNSGIEAVTLKDGRHLLVYNPLTAGQTGWGKRSTLSLAISDDGISWTTVADLEKEKSGEFSYPAIIQTEDGFVQITYTWKREKVKHVVVDPSQFRMQNKGKELAVVRP